MLKIGYVRLRDADPATETAALKALGCHVVRAEEPAVPAGDDTAVLLSILDFIGPGDQLVVTRLQHLGESCRAILDAIDRLDGRGAYLTVTDQNLTSEGSGGRALRAALEAVAAVEPSSAGLSRRRPAVADEIRQLQQAGVGPVEIARRLGVSRMTVWRKLKALETAEA